MMKKYLLYSFLVLLGASNLMSQYYDTSAMRVIQLNRTANEGDLYLDTIHNVYRIGLSNGKLGYVSKTNSIDSISIVNDSLFVIHYFNGEKDTADISVTQNNGWKTVGNNSIDDTKNFIGTKNSADLVFKTNSTEQMRLNDTGDLILNNYPNTRGNDDYDRLNNLYTNSNGQLLSARREIIPPTAFINASTTSSGNTFNYYNFYSSQVTSAGYTPIPSGNLSFVVFSFDPAVFNNVSISTTGILTYDVIATSESKTFIDVRFITK